MAINNVLRVVAFGEYLGEDWVNVFWYRHITAVTEQPSSELAAAFVQDIIPLWRAMTTTENIFKMLQVQNQAFYQDFAEYLFTGDIRGLRTRAVNTDAPSAVALGMYSNRGGIGMRRSQKRFCGILDTDFSGNQVDNGLLVLASALGNGMALDLVWDPTGDGFRPVHVVDGINPPLYKEYQYSITQWTPNNVISSQRSRKP